jgi:hypothetical protein
VHLKRPGVPEALAAILGGVCVTAGLRLTGYSDAGLWTANTLGLLASCAAFALAFVVRSRRPRNAESG